VTWIEIQYAKELGIPVLAFLLHEDAPWPVSLIEVCASLWKSC
jgi:hypothetical protein